VAQYKQSTLRLLHFFKTDPSVPKPLQTLLATLGLPRDEYNRSGHWSPQLYVRSALRLVGARVLTQADVVRSEWRGDGGAVGVGDYTVDVPGPVQLIAEGGEVVSEGALKVPFFCDPGTAPFPLPYSILTPRRGEAANLLVPVAASASHVAFNSIRLEPTWMVLGQAAGVAAAMASVGRRLGPGGVRGVDVAALRKRLRALGQVLEPRS
jgi:hypothetical protein